MRALPALLIALIVTAAENVKPAMADIMLHQAAHALLVHLNSVLIVWFAQLQTAFRARRFIRLMKIRLKTLHVKKVIINSDAMTIIL